MDKWYVIVATGPSLQRKDAEALRYAGTTVAINCGVFYAPWAKFLFAADAVWWRYYAPKIDWYQGHRVSRSYRGSHIEQWRGKNWPGQAVTQAIWRSSTPSTRAPSVSLC